MIENQSRKKRKEKKGEEKEKRGEKSYSPSLVSKLTFLARRVISWSAILTSSWMRRNDENTGVLVNSCQLGNNDVVDASWRKYVARPLHFFPSLSLPLPLSSSLFAKSHWKPTYRDFLRDNSSAICEETLKPFFYGTQQGDYFPILHSSPVSLLRPDGRAKYVGGGFSSWISSSCTQWYMREIVVLTVIWEFQVKKNEMCTRFSEFFFFFFSYNLHVKHINLNSYIIDWYCFPNLFPSLFNNFFPTIPNNFLIDITCGKLRRLRE